MSSQNLQNMDGQDLVRQIKASGEPIEVKEVSWFGWVEGDPLSVRVIPHGDFLPVEPEFRSVRMSGRCDADSEGR